jgi:hypothetical protein
MCDEGRVSIIRGKRDVHTGQGGDLKFIIVGKNNTDISESVQYSFHGCLGIYPRRTYTDCAYGAAVSRIQPAISTLRSTRPLSSRTQESEMEVLKTHRTLGVQPRIATRSTATRARGVHIHPAHEAREIHARIPRAIDTHTSFQHCWSPKTGSRQQMRRGIDLVHLPPPSRVRLAMRGGARPHPQATSGRTSTRIYHRASHAHIAMYPLTPTVASTSYTDPIVSHRLRNIHPHWHVSNPRARRCR